MKRKLLILLLASAAALCVAFALPACIGDDGQDGKQNADGHKLTHVEAAEPTCTENGNVEYWICSECDKTFADAQAKEEIANIVIPALGHNFENGVCTQCGMNEPVTEGIVYTLSDDGQSYSVTDYTGTDTEVYIRSVYNGLPVTSIDENTFYNCREITSIYIPDSVTSIGYAAFQLCVSLTQINIPSSVANIGIALFADCLELTNVTVAEDNAVYHSAGNCIIETASKTLVAGCKGSVIPDDGSVTSIGNFAFWGCELLTSINIPDNITNIGEGAFSRCFSLTTITIPTSVKHIGYDAFGICPKLIEVYNLSELEITAGSDDNGGVAHYAKDVYTSTSEKSKLNETDDGFITYVNEATGEYYLMGYAGNKTEITLPDDIDGHNYEIYNWAFGVNFTLTRVTMPNSVTKIGDYAFSTCSSLKSLTIGYGVTNIDYYAFYNCISLETVYYTGSEAEWNSIDIDGQGDSYFHNAEKVFNYKG